MSSETCGGCLNLGNHRRHCPRHPNYHPWLILADRAESIGDSIGVPGLANRAWALAGAIRAEMPNHPYRPMTQPAATTPAVDTTREAKATNHTESPTTGDAA